MQFGCFSGIHKCPHCRKPFEYDVNDFHRKITCGNADCPKKFGFWMHHVSERRENQVRKEVKADQEQRLKKREQRGGRAARAAGRKRAAAAAVAKKKQKQKQKNKSSKSKSSNSSSSANELTDEEKAFVLGLTDNCPKCGRTVRGAAGETMLREHLEQCDDEKRHAKYQREKARAEARQASAATTQDKQEEMMLEKQWEYQGCQAGQLWMLSENSVRRQCEQRGLSTEGALHELIARLAPLLRLKEKGRYLTDGTQSGSSSSSSSGGTSSSNTQSATDVNLPTNMNTMSARQLRAVAASCGVKVGENDAKVDIIEALERARFKHLAPGLMLSDQPGEDGVKKSKKRDRSDSDDDSEDSEKDEQPTNKKSKAHVITVVISDESDNDDGSDFCEIVEPMD